MVFGLRRDASREVVLEPLPCREEEWFRTLPSDRRAQMERGHEQRQLRALELLRRERALPWREAPLFAAIWGVADLACGLATATSVTGALALGWILGWAGVRLGAGANVTAAVALAAFMAFECVVNHGWSGRHLVLFPAVGVFLFLVANRGEDRFGA